MQPLHVATGGCKNIPYHACNASTGRQLQNTGFAQEVNKVALPHHHPLSVVIMKLTLPMMKPVEYPVCVRLRHLKANDLHPTHVRGYFLYAAQSQQCHASNEALEAFQRQLILAILQHRLWVVEPNLLHYLFICPPCGAKRLITQSHLLTQPLYLLLEVCWVCSRIHSHDPALLEDCLQSHQVYAVPELPSSCEQLPDLFNT
mmetsp:Transcript_36603/g.84164  ORF Transcript_36603/g.84164 Transcript_36603/m.84164 type:complete len:202 (-) Transcript_36603:391-996(-)